LLLRRLNTAYTLAPKLRPPHRDAPLTKKKFIHMKTTLLFLGGVGFQEILLIGLFVLVFFGAKKIPEFMKGLGKGVKEFKDAVKDVKKEVEEGASAGKIED
jgi:sec-independent protein translocase protein TatA